MLPTVFVSHGSPMIMLQQTKAHEFLTHFGQQLGRPEAIIVASAHYESDMPTVTSDAQPRMIYDFGGFPKPLYEMTYSAPGAPDLAERIVAMLGQKGVNARTQADRGYDHGTWVPLKLMYPDASIPIVQISVQSRQSASAHIELARALAPLRHENILIMGSGSLTHNLYELIRSGMQLDGKAPEWVEAFASWAYEKASAGDLDALSHYLERAPFARENHPSPEHYLPLPFALAAAGEGAKGERVHTSCEYGVLMMDTYIFN
jgi:4,5-DOPA dioxygenase extradiol